jgi:hypothetical protein
MSHLLLDTSPKWVTPAWEVFQRPFISGELEIVNSAEELGVAWHYRMGDHAAGTLICPGGCTRTEACTSIEERHGRRVTEIICAGRP